VVSFGLAKLMRKPHAKVIPLGTYSNQQIDIRDNSLGADGEYLLYVGTLEGRNFHQIIEGLSIFNLSHPERNFTLKIVTGTTGETLSEIERLIRSLGQSEKVIIYSWKNREQLKEFFRGASAGIVHVPSDAKYIGQPSTKLFEYLSFGLPIISTVYSETAEISTMPLGVFYEPSCKGFVQALEQFSFQKYRFELSLARKIVEELEWEKIVWNHLEPTLLECT